MANSPKVPRGTNTVFKAASEALDALPQKSRIAAAKAFAQLWMSHVLDNAASWDAPKQTRAAAGASATAEPAKKRGRKPGKAMASTGRRGRPRKVQATMNGHAPPESEQATAA